MKKNLFIEKTIKNINSTIQKVVLLFFVFTVTSPVSAQFREWSGDPNDPKSSCLVDGIPTLKCLEVLFGNLLFLSNTFIILVLFIMFVIGSFNFLTSLGNPEKIETAKGTFKWAIIGLILYASAYLILTLIDIIFLGGQGKLFQFRIGT